MAKETLSLVLVANRLMSFLTSFPGFGASRSANPAPTTPPASNGIILEFSLFVSPSFITITPSFIQFFYEGCDLDLMSSFSPENVPRCSTKLIFEVLMRY
jgi:hypothetical protein